MIVLAMGEVGLQTLVRLASFGISTYNEKEVHGID
jgi:hypothetical protein